MLVLTNTDPQTISHGDNVRYDTVALETGRASSHRKNCGAVTLIEKGLYEVTFRANVGGFARSVIELAITFGDEPLHETIMRTTVDSNADERCVASFTVVRNATGCNEKVCVRNIGYTDAEITNPCLAVRHI